jgi:hypothetical protein
LSYPGEIGTLDRFQQNAERLGFSSADRLRLYEALPGEVREAWDARRLAQIADRRFVAGQVGLKSYKRRGLPRPKVTRAAGPAPDDWRDGVEVLAGIPAEDYLPVLDPYTEPSRGRCRCPLPDHEDRNPSATYRDSVWYCHRCATGGGIFTAAAAISGLQDRGDEFGELCKWVAERMLGAAV